MIVWRLPGGRVVPRPIATVDLTNVTRATLASLDGFVASWWADSDTGAFEATAVIDFFLEGGDLILLQDDSAHDAIDEQLGIPTSSASDGSVSTGGAPLFEGPFGSASNVVQSGNTGQLSAVDVASNGGTVGATNGSGQITAAFWNRGDYAPGAGRLLIVADVDMWATTNAIYAPLNDNGVFALNGTAFASAATAYILGGPDASYTPGSTFWSWDGGVLITGYRGAVEDPSNFGPAGLLVPRPITSVDLTNVTDATLAQLDGFIATWWADVDTTAAEATAVIDFFLAGGDLILLQDDSGHDAIGEQLGIPTSSASDGSVSNGGPPLFLGPFGSASNVVQSGSTGQLSAVDVASNGGTVGATNSSGQGSACRNPDEDAFVSRERFRQSQGIVTIDWNDLVDDVHRDRVFRQLRYEVRTPPLHEVRAKHGVTVRWRAVVESFLRYAAAENR